MKVLIVLALVAYCSAFQFAKEWEEWKVKHSKWYTSDMEELVRHEIFEKNFVYVQMHNENKDIHGFELEMNKFADLESGEFSKIYNGYLKHIKKRSNSTEKIYKPANLAIPSSMDWRTKGVVTGVKNQGQCGSCWAFSTTGSVEACDALKSGTLTSLSEQELVDCSGSYGNYGCDGGLMDNAFNYIKDHKDDTEACYPYVAHDEKCHAKTSCAEGTVTGHVDIPSENEKALTEAIADKQPISVAIDASHASFQMYSSGVYYEAACSQTELDHGVLAVGYGSDSGKDYYIVKNSWGTDWGMQGYIWMSRNRDNNCGIATDASYPLC